MADPTPKQQAVNLINQAQKILIVPGRPDGDSIGSALAIYMALESLGKTVSIAVMDDIPANYQFLPAIDKVVRELQGTRDFIITIVTPGTEPEKLSYNVDNGHLNIVITPKGGQYRPEDVSFKEGSYKYDLIITLDAASPTQLGRIYDAHPTLFTEIPTINIDHHPTNTMFGTVNLVDVTATSAAEVLVSLFESMSVQVTPDIATAILTGIISDTGSFQHANTTPKSLTVAAQMVGFGARQQEIIKYLFKTRSLASLKLWGQVLSNLKFDESTKFVCSVITYEDLTAQGGTKDDLTGVIDELMTAIPGAEIVILLTERAPQEVYGSIRTLKGVDATQIAAIFGGGGHVGAAGFTILGMSPSEVEPLVAEKVREFQLARLGAALPTK